MSGSKVLRISSGPETRVSQEFQNCRFVSATPGASTIFPEETEVLALVPGAYRIPPHGDASPGARGCWTTPRNTVEK